MKFETMPSEESESAPHHSSEEMAIPAEFGGPLRPNHLITSQFGIQEAAPILGRLRVVHNVRLLTPERPLAIRGAFIPAEYRLEIMSPTDRHEPASEEYVRFVYEALRDARVAVRRVLPDHDQSRASE